MRSRWREWLGRHRYLSVVAYALIALAGLAAVAVAIGFVLWVLGLALFTELSR